MTTLTLWRCIPCGMTNYGTDGPFCIKCGRTREVATDAARWERFFAVDAVIVATSICAVTVSRSIDGFPTVEYCRLPSGHPGRHSATIIPCDDCHRTDGTHNLDVEH